MGKRAISSREVVVHSSAPISLTENGIISIRLLGKHAEESIAAIEVLGIDMISLCR